MLDTGCVLVMLSVISMTWEDGSCVGAELSKRDIVGYF